MRKNNKGFTLIEMLIVVAIIAILVAVSIPLVNNSLERTRRATDAANERAAKAEAVIEYLGDDFTTGRKIYDAKTGKLVGVGEAVDGYGKCETHKNGQIWVEMGDDGEVTVLWAVGGALQGPESSHNGNVDEGT